MNIINKKLIGCFVDVIGYIDIVLEFECFNDYRDDYVMIRSELLKWVKDYYKNKSFDCITYERSLEIHNKLQEIRDVKIFDKNIGMEAMLTDNILIMYNALVKMINDELS